MDGPPSCYGQTIITIDEVVAHGVGLHAWTGYNIVTGMVKGGPLLKGTDIAGGPSLGVVGEGGGSAQPVRKRRELVQ